MAETVPLLFITYWRNTLGDGRCARRCSLCGRHIMHGMDVARELPPPKKRGCVGGIRRFLICDGCAQVIQAASTEFARTERVKRTYPVRGCRCGVCTPLHEKEGER